MTIKQVADLLGVSQRTVHRHVKRGALVGTKVGGLWRIEHCDIMAFLKHTLKGSQAIGDPGCDGPVRVKSERRKFIEKASLLMLVEHVRLVSAGYGRPNPYRLSVVDAQALWDAIEELEPVERGAIVADGAFEPWCSDCGAHRAVDERGLCVACSDEEVDANV